MTDIIYPTHPDLTGMPAEFAQNNAAAPMANPYQTQPQNFPPQSYPQTMTPQPVQSQPAQSQPVQPQPVQPQAAQPQPIQPQDYQQSLAAPVEHVAVAPEQPAADTNLLQDVTWPTVEESPVAPQPVPQAISQAGIQAVEYASQAMPQTALNAAPSPAYPPMPVLTAQTPQLAAGHAPFQRPLMKGKDAAAKDEGSKSLFGSLKQRFGSKSKEAEVKIDAPKKVKAKKTKIKKAKVKTGADVEEIFTPELFNPLADKLNVPNLPNTDSLTAIPSAAAGAVTGAVAGTVTGAVTGAAVKADKIKKPRFSPLAFLLGLLCGFGLAFVFLVLSDVFSPQKEYAKVESKTSASQPVVEKLNDELIETVTESDATFEKGVEPVFLDEQLSSVD